MTEPDWKKDLLTYFQRNKDSGILLIKVDLDIFNGEEKLSYLRELAATYADKDVEIVYHRSSHECGGECCELDEDGKEIWYG